MRARHHEAPGAHRGQSLERHRHPIGGFHLLLLHVQFGRGRADNGFDRCCVLLGRHINFDTEFARLLLEPAHRVSRRGIVAIEFVGGGADLGQRAEGGEEQHGGWIEGVPAKGNSGRARGER
ncbi:MAG: hypothetical protein DCF16_16235 [Alphaproteobacteria bacterium]|nr:MAG: hypothetical protein DCF16_16235 [Alphaproteobacteria bacterium]